MDNWYVMDLAYQHLEQEEAIGAGATSVKTPNYISASGVPQTGFLYSRGGSI